MCNNSEEFKIENFNRLSNIFIEASAGTGKTYTIQQIVAKLITEGVSLNKILMVTYTEKAAGELRDRIRQKIQDSLKVENNTNFEEALKLVDTASIHTIHSFCQKTLEEFAFNAGRPLCMDLIDDDEFESYVAKWIRDDLWKACSNNNVTSWPELFNTQAESKVFGKDVKDQLKDGIKKYYLNNNGEEDPSIVSFDDNQEENKEQFLKEYIPVLYKAWQNEKAKRKLQSYNDMIRSVREAVCEENSQLLEQLKAKYTYAIIDEFQDTNQLQWDIFKKVFLTPDDHYIYVVGDPKQAIYSFQGADVNVYKKAIGEIKAKGIGYVLGTNYRSTDSMVEACKKLFSKGAFFQNNNNANLLNFSGSKPCGKFKESLLDGKQVKPFWIAYKEEMLPDEKRVSSGKKKAVRIDFAGIVAEQIVECCSYKGEKTLLQIYDRGAEQPRNVTFKDFAILARTKYEMLEYKRALTAAGVPWIHYKDASLFTENECAHWMTLLKAIEANDFTGRNRQVLSKALYTAFFNVKLDDIKNSKYDDPSADIRNQLIQWHELAQKRKWGKMVECILEYTQIEERYATLDKLQELMKFKQIGNYLVNYLQSRNCDLSDAIKHLHLLSKKIDEEDGGIVAIGSDFDCVQIMTMHASKGLEFPVVIMAGGSADAKVKDKVFLYHDEQNMARLNMGHYGKTKREEEQKQENERLFYVGLTRARSILMMAYFGSKMESYSNSLFAFIKENENDYRRLPDCQGKDLKTQVAEILNAAKGNATDESNEPDTAGLSGKAWGRRLRKHSYSSLSHGKEHEEPGLSVGDSNARTDKEQQASNSFSLADVDRNGIYYPYSSVTVDRKPLINNYPKGTELGSALHEVFELADYAGVENTLDDAKNNDALRALVIRCLRKYGFKVDEEDSKRWVEQSVVFIWNTLNARLPQIKGGGINSSADFILKNGASTRLAEVEFNMNVDDFKNYCTGSIDLLFEHDGVYSILDWKTDSLVPAIYGDADEIKKIVDARYSIQRVLYAYNLIKWLKQFHIGKTEEDIFNEKFGGVYYVFLRATEADTFAGTYSHTWQSWKQLEDAYENIKNNKIVSARKEDDTNE